MSKSGKKEDSRKWDPAQERGEGTSQGDGDGGPQAGGLTAEERAAGPAGSESQSYRNVLSDSERTGWNSQCL